MMSLPPPSAGYMSVRPELDCIVEYIPGESVEAFSARTGIPLHQLVKLNSNESPYGPLPEVLKALSNYTNYKIYPDTNSAALPTAISTYTGLRPKLIVASHRSSALTRLHWYI